MDLIGKRIRQCRRLLGMTQEELAGEELTKAFISLIEQGKAMPSIETLLLLAKRLHQRPGYFLEPDAELDAEAIADAWREKARQTK